MKPADVIVSKEPPPFDSEGFFGAPYESDKKPGPCSLFVMGDLGLAGISKSIEPHVFRSLTTSVGGEVITLATTPGAFRVPFPGPSDTVNASSSAQAARGRQMTSVILEEHGLTKARFSK